MNNTKFVLTRADENILTMMSKGMTYTKISEKLISNGNSPNSISYIEKLVKRIKKNYKAETSFQLGVVLCRNGVLK